MGEEEIDYGEDTERELCEVVLRQSEEDAAKQVETFDMVRYKAMLRQKSARDILAAVNACSGIPTEALEDGVVGDMREALKHLIIHAENQSGDDSSEDAMFQRAIDSAHNVIRKAEPKDKEVEG